MKESTCTSKLVTSVQSPVRVKKGKKPDIKGSIEVTVDGTNYNGQQIPFVLQEKYSELWTKTFQQCNRKELAYSHTKLVLINNKLWGVSGSNLYVYEKECQLLQKHEHKQFDYARNLTASDTGSIIVACFEGYGLHECQSTGEYKSQIASGYFSDVTTFNGQLYALECVQGKLLVLERNGEEWVEKKQYKLQSDYSGGDRICVNTRGICISSYNNNCIYVYNLKFEYLKKMELGSFGDANGEFNRPLLCGIDEVDNVLVADYWNNRLHVYQACKVNGIRYVSPVLPR